MLLSPPFSFLLTGHLLSEFARPLGEQEDERDTKERGDGRIAGPPRVALPPSTWGFFFLLSCLIDLEADVPGRPASSISLLLAFYHGMLGTVNNTTQTPT